MAPVLPADFQAVISDPTATLCGNFVNTLLKLPNLLYKLVNYIFDANGNLTVAFQKAVTDLTTRPGDLIFSASSLDTNGRLLCDGAVVSRTTYATLFAAIGTRYGAGDGSTTFGIPDFTDRFPIGASSTKPVGVTGGEATKTIALVNMPPHTHDCLAIDSASGSGTFLFQDNAVNSKSQSNATVLTESAGGIGSPPVAQPFDIMPPWFAAYVYVKI